MENSFRVELVAVGCGKLLGRACLVGDGNLGEDRTKMATVFPAVSSFLILKSAGLAWFSCIQGSGALYKKMTVRLFGKLCTKWFAIRTHCELKPFLAAPLSAG
ncbi:hypothetical protein ES703_81492 [subsurface metagenome]